MIERSPGLTSDPLFVGATRPPMRWGVSFAALMCNTILTMELFLATRNLLTLSLCLPVHGVCALLCARDPRFFDLLQLWARTRLPALLASRRFWGASSYSPLMIEAADSRGHRPRAHGVVCRLGIAVDRSSC